ncbi:MAG: cysteine hydrolase [Chloroflexota bacterium]|nr:cysteine hydrolase [Chloroflexota bacterium]
MAAIREGDKSALLIVDMQVAVMDETWEESRIIRNAARAVEKARKSGTPVIWIQQTHKKMVHGGPDWQLVPGLTSRSGDIRLDKQFNSSFEQTALEETLADIGVSHIVLAGALTNWCIRATAYAALDKGYDLTLIADAHTTGDTDFEDGGTIKAQHLIHELNIVMSWLNYPGRINRAISVEDLAF